MTLKRMRKNAMRKLILDNACFGIILMFTFLGYLLVTDLLRITKLLWISPTLGMIIYCVVLCIYLIIYIVRSHKMLKLFDDCDKTKPNKIDEIANEIFEDNDIQKITIIRVSNKKHFTEIDKGVYMN